MARVSVTWVSYVTISCEKYVYYMLLQVKFVHFSKYRYHMHLSHILIVLLKFFKHSLLAILAVAIYCHFFKINK